MCWSKWSVISTGKEGACSMTQLSLLLGLDDEFSCSCTQTCAHDLPHRATTFREHLLVKTLMQWSDDPPLLTFCVLIYVCVITVNVSRQPNQYRIFGADADIRRQENSDIRYIWAHIMYIWYLLNVVIKYLWWRYVVQAAYLTFLQTLFQTSEHWKANTSTHSY